MTTLEQPPAMTPYGARHTEPEGRRARARAQALAGFRTFGALTAGLRADPDYLIIGTKRGGTTSLARWLLLHPAIAPLWPARETRKGTYYFDVNYGRGHRWYRSHFPTRLAHRGRELIGGRPMLVGEATPYYLHHPHAAIRARQLVPAVKVIALLRHPVDRAHGHWAERRRQGVEPLDFPEALAAEPERLAGEEERMLVDPRYVSFAHQHYSYVDQSRYARGLGRWLSVFPAHQVLVLRSEDLYDDPTLVYNQVLEFLGLPSFLPPELEGWNQVAKPAVADGHRERLLRQLRPDIEAVETLLDRKLHWT
ncbi:MAG: sulfotransferase domain-containing protein [Actinomycetota bacterium]